MKVSIAFSVYKKTLQVNNLKTRTAMNAKISGFLICIEVIIYLLLDNLHDCTFNNVTLKFIQNDLQNAD